MDKRNTVLVLFFGTATILLLAYLALPTMLKDVSQPSVQSNQDLISEVEGVRDTISRAADEKKNFTRDLNLSEDVYVTVEGAANIIQIENPRKKRLYPEKWQLVNGTTLQGTSLGSGDFGLDSYDEDSVIAARSLPDGKSIYHIEFRELKTGSGNINFINIKGDWSIMGPEELDVNYLGTKNQTIGTEDGEPVQRKIRKVKVSFN